MAVLNPPRRARMPSEMARPLGSSAPLLMRNPEDSRSMAVVRRKLFNRRLFKPMDAGVLVITEFI